MSLTFDHVYGFYCDPFILGRLAPDHNNTVLPHGYLAPRFSLQHTDHRAFPPYQTGYLGSRYLYYSTVGNLAQPRTLHGEKRVSSPIEREHLRQHYISNIE